MSIISVILQEHQEHFLNNQGQISSPSSHLFQALPVVCQKCLKCLPVYIEMNKSGMPISCIFLDFINLVCVPYRMSVHVW